MSIKAGLSRFLRQVSDRLNGEQAPTKAPPNEAELFRFVLGEINQVLWVDNLEKKNSLLNVGDYESLFDRPRERLKSDPLDWMNAIHPEDRPSIEASLHLQKTGDYDVQYRVVHKSGAIKWLRDRSFLIRDETGAPTYLAGLVMDITSQVRLEEQVRHDQKMKAVGALSGGICHDFNNVLAVIHGYLELSLSEELSPDVTRYLTAALGASSRGATLTHRLLAYSRKQPLSPKPISPAILINDLEVLLKQSLSEAIHLEIVSGAGLWRCLADKDELETVLLNLAINAQQAMKNTGKLTIEVFNTRIDDDYARVHEEVDPGQYVCFAVTDNGVGMSPEIVDQAFDPFFTTKAHGEGSGLGLSMAYGFAKQSGGHIKIYSEVGEGTTVKLYIPRSLDFSAQQMHLTDDLNRRFLHGKSVLVVENEPAVRDTVDLQLKRFGCRTVSVGTANEALAAIACGQVFDLLLCDVVLGGHLAGPDLAQLIQKEIPALRVLFMSGFTENAIIHDGKLDAGVNLVQKPFTKDQLLSACLRAIG
ncbi:ATP-binding protein [Antarctobacter jejuensis]|uniref:ATP-binding protein n=1 Tax=Antarctobacter jejuensis TaxID=1439938 RepID=UPI003FD4F29A